MRGIEQTMQGADEFPGRGTVARPLRGRARAANKKVESRVGLNVVTTEARPNHKSSRGTDALTAPPNATIGSGAPLVAATVPSLVDEFGPSAWRRTELERRDFYHRTREFPRDVSQWRNGVVALIAAAPLGRFPNIPAGATSEAIRAYVDDGISKLRQINEILVALYGDPPSSQRHDENLWGEKHARRILTRIGVFAETGVVERGLDRDDLDGTTSLIPPNLRFAFSSGLKIHGTNVCTERNPKCVDCDLRSFCSDFRDRWATQTEQSDAPVTVDLFCGAGGLTEGFSRAGFRASLVADYDEMSLRTFRFNHPQVRDANVLLCDVRELTAERLRKTLAGRPLDVLVGAPPCQGFSMAGNRSKRTAKTPGVGVRLDERNYLFESFVKLAIELKPRLVLMENVPGMETACVQGRSFTDMATSALEAGGFVTARWKLDAAAFGVPQERTRLFVVASRSKTLPAKPFGEYQTLHHGDFDPDALPQVTFDDATFDLPPIAAGEGLAVRRWSPKADSDRRWRRFLGKFSLVTSPRILFNHTVRYHNERDLELYSLLAPGEDSVHILERGRRDLMRYRSEVFDDKYLRLRGDRPCKTIVSHLAKDGNGYVHPRQDRSISFREAARVQSFHDAYVFCGSPTDQWIQLGNAVPPVFGEAIARSFRDYLSRNK